MRNAGLEEAQAGIKIAGRNINNFRYADDTTLMAESEEELKSLLIKVKEESGKNWLKAQHSENEDQGIRSHHFMKIDGETVETVSDFIFLGSKITADGDCSHEIKRCLLLGRKVMTNLDSILKGRDITLSTKVHPVKAMVFPVVMYGCESWTVKRAEHWRIDAFWTVVLEKTLESPLDCKEIQPVHSKGDQPWGFFGRNDAKAETPVLWPPHVKVDSLEKTDAGRDWGQEEMGLTEDEMAGWHHWLDGRESEWTPGSWWWTGRPGVLRFMVSEKVGHDCETELNWTKGDQPWVFFGRNDAKSETPILWPPHVVSLLIRKDSDDGRDWGQEEKGTTEDEMARWHHRLNGCQFEWTPGHGDGQGGLGCCDSWGFKYSDTTERLNWTELLELRGV